MIPPLLFLDASKGNTKILHPLGSGSLSNSLAKSFDFSFDGENPATAMRYINAKLSLYFQIFKDPQ